MMDDARRAQIDALEIDLQRGIVANLAHGTLPAEGPRFGGRHPRSAAPEPLEHRWQRIVDALPDSPETRAWQLRRIRRDRVRYGIRRLRMGTSRRWQRPLPIVLAETIATLRELGHQRIARWITGEARDAGAFRRCRRACVRALARRRRRGRARSSDLADLTRWLDDLGHADLPCKGEWYEPEPERT